MTVGGMWRGRRPGPAACCRNFVRIVIIFTVLTTACVSSLQATVLRFDEVRGWEGRNIRSGGPHPLEVGTVASSSLSRGQAGDMASHHSGSSSSGAGSNGDGKMLARGDEISPCSPNHPNSIKGTNLFLSLKEMDADALVSDYFDANTCEWDLLKLETYVVVTRLDSEKNQERGEMSGGRGMHGSHGIGIGIGMDDDEFSRDDQWDSDTSAYFDQVICVSGGVGTIWGMFNPPQRLIKLTAQCKEGGRCLGVFIGNLLIYIWCAIFLLGIPELVLVWVQCGWNQVAWLWVVWVTFFIARTQTAWVEYLRSSNWCRRSSLHFLCHVDNDTHHHLNSTLTQIRKKNKKKRQQHLQQQQQQQHREHAQSEPTDSTG
mmetsp:Transcript_18578/g.37563  ORF Transcript_18578/g.37563 Transcript_18578/m.37563 type:complete len:373 (+) Transcript_18578:165-1283(+)